MPPRTKTAQAADVGQTTDHGSLETPLAEIAVRFMSTKPVLRAASVGAVALLAGIGWLFGDGGRIPMPDWMMPRAAASEQSALPPGKYWLVTIDNSETDPAKRIQRKEIDFIGGKVQRGTYRYVGEPGSGQARAVKRLGETLAISFWSEKPDGPGVGAAFLRPIDYRDASLGRVWTGFEVGVDCECSPGIAIAGPFSSVPAILSASPNPPAELLAMAAKVTTLQEIRFFPEDVLKKTATPAAAP